MLLKCMTLMIKGVSQQFCCVDLRVGSLNVGKLPTFKCTV